MMDRIDCQVFEDQLDALARDELPAEAIAQLRGHAERCADCATQLRVQEHLVTPSLGALEAEVPDVWVAGMSERVEAALQAGSPRSRRRPSWVVPAVAAAMVTLLVNVALTRNALHRAEARELTLSEQVLDQQRRLTALEEPATAGPTLNSSLAGRDGWLRSLNSQGTLTVDELRAVLSGLPGGTTLFTASQSSTLTVSRFMPAVWREAFARLQTTDEVTARDLLGVLDDLDLPDDASVPTSRLLAILS